MNPRETDPRLAEAMREQKPPMLRCWVNEHSGAMLFPEEAHVIIEGIGDMVDWSVVPKEEIVFLGVSQKADALGPLRDAYVHVSIILSLSDEVGYMIQLGGIDPIRMRVARDLVIFAQPQDPVWDEIRERLEKESKDRVVEFKSLPPDQVAVDLTDGSYVPLKED